MTENPHIFIQIGFATCMGSFAGHWLHTGGKQPNTVIFVFIAAILILALSSLGDFVLFVMGSILFALNAAAVPFVYYLKSIDDKRAAKQKEKAAKVISDKTQNSA